MRRLFAMIAMAMSAVRVVWERCADTGAWVARTVVAPFSSGGGTMPDEAVEGLPEASSAVDGVGGIKRLAGAMASDRVTAEDLADVPENQIEWLAAMDRSMLARVMCADDGAIRDHMAGRRAIRNVLAADQESIAAYRKRMAMSVNVTDDDEMEMAYAA